jgi:hypothetical protein
MNNLEKLEKLEKIEIYKLYRLSSFPLTLFVNEDDAIQMTIEANKLIDEFRPPEKKIYFWQSQPQPINFKYITINDLFYFDKNKLIKLLSFEFDKTNSSTNYEIIYELNDDIKSKIIEKYKKRIIKNKSFIYYS